MANRDMKLNVIVRLRDQMSGVMNKLRGNLEKTAATARKIGAVGAIIAGISFMGPMQEAAAFQQQLIDIAGTAELSGDAAFKFVDEAKTKYEAMALEIGQTSENIAKGAGQMIAAGLDVSQVNGSIKDVGKAATAANASFDDMSKVATSMMLNLKVPAEDVRDSLGALVVAGKMGSFELKDMAREFPNLTSQVSKFGVTGREAVNFLGSGLQIAMKGASDTSVAANNFSNFLAKALAPRTVKNFAGMGVDIQAVMQDAVAKGINPLEAMMQKVGKLTGVSEADIAGYMKKAKENGLQGAEALGFVREQLTKIGAAGKMSELFGDQQVLDFIVPMMANIDEFKSIKEKVAEATGASTEIDFETQMQGLNQQLTIFKEIGTQASREVGFAFGSWLPMINDGLQSLLKKFREMDAATGGNLKKALAFGAGLVLLATAIGAVGVVLPAILAGFGAIGAVIGLILSPIGLLIAALAGIGVMIWQNWDKVGPKLLKFWNGIKDTALKAWNAIKGAWAKLAPYFAQIWQRLTSGAGKAWNFIEGYAVKAWQSLAATISSMFSAVNWDNVGAGLVGAYDTTLRALGATWEWLGQVWNGFKPSLEGIGKSFQNTFGALGGTWENIKGIASGLGELAGALGKMLGLGDGGGEKIGNFIGKFAGGIAQLAAIGINAVAYSLQVISGAIRLLVDVLNGKTPDWRKFFPESFVALLDKISAKIQAIKDGFNAVKNFVGLGETANELAERHGLPPLPDLSTPSLPATPLQAQPMPNPNATYPRQFTLPDRLDLSSLNSGARTGIERGQLGQALPNSAPQMPSLTPNIDNSIQNAIGSALQNQAPIADRVEFMPPPPQQVDVNSTSVVEMRYTGPITGPQTVTTNNRQTATSDGGAAVGRL